MCPMHWRMGWDPINLGRSVHKVVSLPDSPQTLSWVLSCYSQTQKELLAQRINCCIAYQAVTHWVLQDLSSGCRSSLQLLLCHLFLGSLFPRCLWNKVIVISWWRKDHKPCVSCPRSKAWKLKSYPFILVIVLPLFLCLPLQTPACRGFLPHDLQLDSIIHPCILFYRTFFCKDFILLSNQSLKVSCSSPKVRPKIQFVSSSL